MRRPSIAPLKIPAWAWKRVKFPARKPQAGPRKLPRWFWAWRKWLFSKNPQPAAPKQGNVTMYDSIDLSQIPSNAQAVAGYVNGRWPTFATLFVKFPHALRVSIAVTDQADADVLDVENGDAVNAQAPAWVRRQYQKGRKKPGVYTSISNAVALLDTLAKEGIARSDVRLWTAHYTGKAHRCTAECGFGFTGEADATQYDDHALGRNLDASLAGPTFFNL